MAPEILVMSLSRWNKLSEGDQQVVRQAARDSVPFMRALWDERVDQARTRLLAAGVEANEVDDINQFIDLMRPVWDRFVVSDQQKRLVAEIEAMGAGA